MNIIYRISEKGYNKEKPEYINNENCFKNAIGVFPPDLHNWVIISDNVSKDTNNMMKKYISEDCILDVSVGNGGGTFNLGLDIALQKESEDDDVVYFLENDYLHRPNSDLIMSEGIKTGASFVSLYDHPDKYLDPAVGGNPLCRGGGESTIVYLTEHTHWKITNSATMTFASKVSTLRRVENTLRHFTIGTCPRDFEMFLELGKLNEFLITPLPGYSTHGEIKWLCPLIDWKKYVNL